MLVDSWLVLFILLLRFLFVDCCDLFVLVIVLSLFVCYAYEYFVVGYMFLLNVVCFFWGVLLVAVVLLAYDACVWLF